MHDARMLAQATACVTTCLDVQGTQAQRKTFLEALIAVSTSKLHNFKHHQLTQDVQEYLRATTSDPHLVRLIDTVEVTCYRYDELDYHVQETLSFTINGSSAITAFYNGDDEGEGDTTISFGGIEGEDPKTMSLLLKDLRRCLGLNEAVSLGTVSAFLRGMMGRRTMMNQWYTCIELLDGFDGLLLGLDYLSTIE